jgi:peptidoglycan/LPS O-acetylase OafA/YrhL
MPVPTMVESSHQVKRHTYRPEIDGIRAFAVVAVIINHINKNFLPSGYLGVDIFFVISGFVITSSLANRTSKNFGDLLVGFYTRRIKRLVPALIMFVLITSFLICLFNPSPASFLRTGITSLFGFSNLYLLRQATDYFADSTELNVFTHTWSLGVEEQFYFLFPFLVWVTGFGQLSAKGAKNLFYVMGALSVASLIAFGFFYTRNQPAAYFSMPTRLWEMGAGCLLFLSFQNPSKYYRAIESISPLIITGAIVLVLFVPLQFAVQATIAVVILTMVLITCLRSKTTAYTLFTHPQVVYIGLISYSLYLWHWGVLSLSRWTVGIHWWSVPFQVALMLLLSFLSYRYIETPLRRSDWSAVRWKTIVYGLSASASAAILLFVLTRVPDSLLYTGHSPSMVATGVSSLEDPYSLKQPNSLWKGEECILSSNSEVGKEISIENCTLGNFSGAKHRVMIFGNSFAAAFIQAFDDLVTSDGYSVTLTASWGASPIPEIPNNTPWSLANDYYWRSIFPSFVDRLQPGDWVFLINDMASFSPINSTQETSEHLSKLENGLRSISKEISEKGVKLAILHGIPFAREANCQPVMAAKQWFTPFGSRCKLSGRSDSLLRRKSLNSLFVSLENEGKLHTVDIFDVFCPEEQCTYNAKNGQFLYRDEYSHPSVEAVRLASPIIRKVLTSS